MTTNDDVSTSYTDTKALLNTLYINSLFFIVLMILFELNRHIRPIYLKRVNKKFINSKRVPDIPPKYPLGWIYSIASVNNDDLIRMIGLDAYMLLRFLILCFR